jgi:hypothetical protein
MTTALSAIEKSIGLQGVISKRQNTSDEQYEGITGILSVIHHCQNPLDLISKKEL